MSNSKRCINCESILSDQSLDFCSEECEHEFKLGCDQELLTTLQLGVANESTGESKHKTEEVDKEFQQLLGNDGKAGKVTKD